MKISEPRLGLDWNDSIFKILFKLQLKDKTNEVERLRIVPNLVKKK